MIFGKEKQGAYKYGKMKFPIFQQNEPNEPELFDRLNRTVRLVEPNRTRTQCSDSERRARMLPETLEKLMFLRYNM